MCLALAGRMVLRLPTSSRWGSEASSEYGVEADFVIDYTQNETLRFPAKASNGESAPPTKSLTNSKITLWMIESVIVERLPRGARYQHARQR